jgi:phosphatidylglycerol lysyltransferase
VKGEVLTLVRRHGWNATAFQTLEDGYSYFFDGADACVAYVDTGRAWVAAGAPLAAGEALGPVAARFVAAARAAGRRCCFVAAEDRLLEAAGGALRSLPLGDQPVWDPRRWPGVLASQRGLREQLRRARAKGVVIRQLTPDELEAGPTREAVERLAARWLETRTVAPLAFLVQVELFSFAPERRLFAAELDGQLVGLAGVVPVPARGGWFLEDLLRDPSAPNGTTELLVDAVMRWAAAAGSEWVTLGLAPLSGEVPPPLRLARWAGGLFYGFEGVRAFKAKLRPTAWTPIHLAYPATQGALVSVMDTLAALTRDGFVRFGLRTLGRGSRPLCAPS